MTPMSGQEGVSTKVSPLLSNLSSASDNEVFDIRKQLSTSLHALDNDLIFSVSDAHIFLSTNHSTFPTQLGGLDGGALNVAYRF